MWKNDSESTRLNGWLDLAPESILISLNLLNFKSLLLNESYEAFLFPVTIFVYYTKGKILYFTRRLVLWVFLSSFAPIKLLHINYRKWPHLLQINAHISYGWMYFNFVAIFMGSDQRSPCRRSRLYPVAPTRSRACGRTRAAAGSRRCRGSRRCSSGTWRPARQGAVLDGVVVDDVEADREADRDPADVDRRCRGARRVLALDEVDEVGRELPVEPPVGNVLAERHRMPLVVGLHGVVGARLPDERELKYSAPRWVTAPIAILTIKRDTAYFYFVLYSTSIFNYSWLITLHSWKQRKNIIFLCFSTRLHYLFA